MKKSQKYFIVGLISLFGLVIGGFLINPILFLISLAGISICILNIWYWEGYEDGLIKKRE